MFKIREFEDNDLHLLEKWLHKEHVKKWFEVPNVCTVDDWLHEVKNRDGEFAWINYFTVSWKDSPVGYCMYYQCADAKEEWYGDTPLDGTYSFDYLIGEESCLGKGIGKMMIAMMIDMIFAEENAQRIIVQPDERNKASCHVLLSNGFIFDENKKIYQITK